MATQVTVSFISYERLNGNEVSRVQVELAEVEALINVLQGAASVLCDGNEFQYISYDVNLYDDELVVQVNID